MWNEEEENRKNYRFFNCIFPGTMADGLSTTQVTVSVRNVDVPA